MKEIDDTPATKSEYEHCNHADHLARFTNEMLDNLRDHARVCQMKIETLQEVVEALQEAAATTRQRVANLETQRTPQDENDDQEWY